jgi:aspartate ammonia-lyase
MQAGSSIMPGKVNPVVPEMVTQVALQVMGTDQVIAAAAASGQLELNAFLPLIAQNLLLSLDMLIKTVRIFAEQCIQGIQANQENCRRWLEEGHGFITALTPYVGYDAAAEMTKRAIREGKKLRDVILESELFTEEELETVFSPGQLTRPGVAGAKLLRRSGDQRDWNES